MSTVGSGPSTRLGFTRRPGAVLAPGVYRELVKLLFTNFIPVLTMSIVYVAVCSLIAIRRGDALLDALVVGGTAAAVARFAVILAFRCSVAPLDDGDARRWERRYAWGSYAFAVMLGLTGLRIVSTSDPTSEMLFTGVLFGYTTGVICRLSVRPWIGLPSLAVAAVPVIIAILSLGGLEQTVLAGVYGLFLLGSLDTVGHLYRVTVNHLTAERVEAGRARRDTLTGLPNRRAAIEGIEAALAAGTPLAVHFLDLDRFKAVNDHHGHPTGDALLRAVAGRLVGTLHHGDMAARLGGDEFLVLQTVATHEAGMLARRIVKAMQAPFVIEGHQVAIGTSVGVALAPDDADRVDDLLARADAALYRAKLRGRNGYAFHAEPELPCPGVEATG